MHCPNCGTETLPEHEFCRSCGAGLWSEKKHSRALSPLLGVILTFAGILISLTGRRILHEDIVVFIGVVTSIIGMMLMAVIPLLSAKNTRGRSRRVAAHPSEFAPAKPTVKLPPINAADEFQSVVEDTTELLHEPIPSQTRR